jgi:hypothetical protein
MKLIRLLRGTFILISVILPGLYFFSSASAAGATSPTVSNLYIPLEGDVTLSNGDVVTFTGQPRSDTGHVSDAFVPTVQMYVNLIEVEGTSATTGRTYLLVGAANVEWVGISPGPPIIPEQMFNFELVESTPGPPTVSPGPPDLPPNPILPLYLRDFVFAQEAGFEGSLQNAVASFVSD